MGLRISPRDGVRPGKAAYPFFVRKTEPVDLKPEPIGSLCSVHVALTG